MVFSCVGCHVNHYPSLSLLYIHKFRLSTQLPSHINYVNIVGWKCTPTIKTACLLVANCRVVTDRGTDVCLNRAHWILCYSYTRNLRQCFDSHVDTAVAPDTRPRLNTFNTLQTLLNGVKSQPSQPTNNVSCTPVYTYHQHDIVSLPKTRQFREVLAS